MWIGRNNIFNYSIEPSEIYYLTAPAESKRKCAFVCEYFIVRNNLD